MANSIVFTDTFGVPEQYFPVPASKVVPQWFKDLDSYISGDKKPDGNGMTTGTIKRCMPVFDSIVSGYIIYTHVDVYVSQKIVEYADKKHFEKTGETKFRTEEEIKELGLPVTQPWYEWPSYEPIQFHPIVQAPNHPLKGGHTVSYPKWMNPWAVKTPPGYSVMFVQPFHRESVFTILPGIVDTDTYTAPVNFPFVLNNDSFEGLIPAGTPMAQVIPFQREDWAMELGNETHLLEQQQVKSKLRTKFFDSYKTQYRQTKEYR